MLLAKNSKLIHTCGFWKFQAETAKTHLWLLEIWSWNTPVAFGNSKLKHTRGFFEILSWNTQVTFENLKLEHSCDFGIFSAKLSKPSPLVFWCFQVVEKETSGMKWVEVLRLNQKSLKQFQSYLIACRNYFFLLYINKVHE